MNRHKLISRTRAKAPHAAFTLIELLIVVAIIAILAAIAVPNFLEAQTRAKVSRAKADMRAMATAAETYHIDYNKYMISDGKNPYYPTSSPHEYDAWGTSSPKDYEAIRQKYSQKYDALFRLTSPISYMSSMPAENPFGEYDAYNVGDKHVGYSYRGTPVMARLSATIYPPEWADTDPAYSISATGPSKKLRDNQGRILVYDPTNGTTSFGGIWYVYGSTSMHSFH